MYGYLRDISVYELVPLAVNCAVSLGAGLVFALFSEDVQRYQVEMRDAPGRVGRWLRKYYPLYGIEDRLVRSESYIFFLKALGFGCIFLSGTLAGILVTYIMSV